MDVKQTSDGKKQCKKQNDKKTVRTLIVVTVDGQQNPERAYTPVSPTQNAVWNGVYDLKGWKETSIPTKSATDKHRDIQYMYSKRHGVFSLDVLFTTVYNTTKSDSWATDRFWFDDRWSTFAQVKGSDEYAEWIYQKMCDRVFFTVIACFMVLYICISSATNYGYSMQRNGEAVPPVADKKNELVNGLPVRLTHPIQIQGMSQLSSAGKGRYRASVFVNRMYVHDTANLQTASETRIADLYVHPLSIKSVVMETTSLMDTVVPGTLPVFLRTYELQLYACDDKHTKCERIAEAAINSLKDAYIYIHEDTGVLMTGSGTKLTELRKP